MLERGIERSGERNGTSPVDATFDEAGIAMALATPEGRWLRVNRALCELVGYSDQEMLDRSSQDIVHPDDLG